MDAFINWNKDFVGKDATAAIKAEGPARKLVTLTIDTPIDVTLDEAVLVGDEAVGYITSGSYAHHVGASMAMAYVAAPHAGAGGKVQVEILGERHGAEIMGAPVYDPNGGRMRS
jgi:dimethylglycine dehydrogenase